MIVLDTNVVSKAMKPSGVGNPRPPSLAVTAPYEAVGVSVINPWET